MWQEREFDIFIFSNTGKCYFCGYSKHSRFRCPAKEALCKGCGKKGHFQKVCQSTPAKSKLLSAVGPQLSASTAATGTRGLKSALINVLVNGKTLTALVDTGSSESYICTEIPTKNKWKVTPSTTLVNMASTTLSKKTEGLCCVSMKYKDREYKNVKLSLLPHLCADVILGHDFLNQHSEVFIPFEGDGPPFSGGPIPAIELCRMFSVDLEILVQEVSVGSVHLEFQR